MIVPNPRPTRPPPAGEGDRRANGGRVGATIGSSVADIADRLAAAGFDEPRRRARRLLAVALGLSPAAIFADPERRLDDADGARVDRVLRRALAHEPLSRIAGTREFWSRKFALSADTLDPRPESETIVEAVLAPLVERTRPWRLLDLGTGTGCLLLALLSELPAASGVGVDIAPDAAVTAQRNAERLSLGSRARFFAGDWAAALAGRFDVVVANPPYIATPELAALPREVRDFDPRRALDGGADGLAAYRAIAAELPRLLLPNGLFATEIGHGQADAVGALLVQNGFAVTGLVADLAGIPRCMVARARHAKKDWNGPLPRLG